MTIRVASTSVIIAAFFALCAGSANAQQTVITNGGVTVRNANGTTTRVTNGGVVTTGRAHSQRSRRRTVRVVQTGTSGGSVSITGSNKRLTVNGRNGIVNVSGSSNRVTVTGTAQRVVVSGSNNFVLTERVGVIEANGTSNQIVWRHGLTRNGSPGIVRNGTNNAITHRP